jgi:hypothetical protein
MQSERQVGRWSSGKVATVTGVLIAAVAGGFAVRAYFGASPAGAAAARRTFICSESRKRFEHVLQRGQTIPVRSPYSSRNTGFPAELCYWTADGRIAPSPTPVLLNVYLGKNEPTFCPECGRLVVGHNPRAEPGMRPPPTRAERKSLAPPAAEDR